MGQSIILFMVLPLVLWCMGLAVALTNDFVLSMQRKWVMVANLVMVLLLILQDYTEFLLIIDPVARPMLRTAVSMFGYICRPIIPVLFMMIVSERRNRLDWILVGINMIVYLSAFFSHAAFWIDENNHFHPGPLKNTCLIVSIALMAHLLYLSLYKIDVRKKKTWIPTAIVAMIVGAVYLDMHLELDDLPVTFLTNAVVAGCNLYYLWLLMEFMQAHERALQEEQQIRLTMSQIQPHFLYNTLSTIQALCRIDPEKAFVTTEKFGTYLRQNLDSMNQPSLIPLSEELDHTRIYAEIEETRFPNIKVEFCIEDDDCFLPALTIQPLVENAIRHGIRGREDGTVWITAYKEPSKHVIVIRDNGKGFDTENMETSEDGGHIGLRAVQERVKNMAYGTMTVESVIGKGTTITVCIPDKFAADKDRR